MAYQMEVVNGRNIPVDGLNVVRSLSQLSGIEFCSHKDPASQEGTAIMSAGESWGHLWSSKGCGKEGHI